MHASRSPAVTGQRPSQPPPHPPLIARLRLPLGYLLIIGAFFANAQNGGRFVWWALGLIAMGSALRVWSAGALKKNRELCTEGPYAISRNPLYLGTFLAGLGLTLFVHSLWLFLFFIVSFTLAYRAQILWEEQVLAHEYGQAFQDYLRRTARFFPTRWPRRALGGAYSFSQMRRNKEVPYQLFWVVMLVGLVSQSYLMAQNIRLSWP